VLHVIPSLSTRTGGPPVAVVESALALRDCGVESTILATDMGTSASAKRRRRVTAQDLPSGADGLDVRLFGTVPPQRLAFSPGLFREVTRIADSYDAVHIHSMFLFPQFAAALAAQRAAVPYIVSTRGALDPHLRRRRSTIKALADVAWQRRALHRAAALHFTSDEEARQAADVAPRVPRIVVPNGVRCSAYASLPSPRVFRDRWLGGSEAPVVLFCGRLARKKGIDVLVRAFAATRRESGDAWLVIAGPDDEGLTPALRALADRQSIGGRTVFAGMLRGEEKLQALAACDVWALPSHGENFGNAVVEAMAAGLAVVVSPEVNIAPAIEAAGAGVVAERTVDAFARAIGALLHDPRERTMLAEAACMVARRYDWTAIAPQLAAMYERVARRERVAA
jgi:glycosyltransferase involved in cell wall biosynthesis